MAASIYRVPTHLAEDLWPSLAEYANRACRYHPFLEGEDVLTLALEQSVVLFVATDERGLMGFAALEVVEYPRCRVANVVAAGGRRGFLPVLTGPMLLEFEAWARERGAWVFSAFGRAGWMRIADRVQGGNRLPLSVIWKEIPDVRRRQENHHAGSARPLGAGGALPH